MIGDRSGFCTSVCMTKAFHDTDGVTSLDQT